MLRGGVREEEVSRSEWSKGGGSVEGCNEGWSKGGGSFEGRNVE